MIRAENNNFILDTANTTYAFRVTKSGHLEHLYYGRKIALDTGDVDCIAEKSQFAPGSTINYTQDDLSFSLEDMCLEMSGYGKGDIREPFVEIVHADGGLTCDFLFESFKTAKENPKLCGMPSSYSDSAAPDHLVVTLFDKHYNLKLELHYYVYERCNVITRFSRLLNTSDKPVRLRRLMSNQLDFPRTGLRLTTFTGAWVREMQKNDTVINSGKVVNSCYAGISSNRANPFVMLSEPTTTEDEGIAYGLNLVYSGNHYEAVEASSFGKSRFVQGINPTGFEFVIKPGEEFESPEAVMTVSSDGFNGMSQNMHKFVRNHIVRGEWKNKPRPILLNSWEAAYFKINEQKLLRLGRAAKKVGIELLVMDDGWFGARNDDTSSLGDWHVNRDKLPNGVGGLAKKVNKLGLDFGIWVEPEMVNSNSDLFRAHPDWALGIPNHPHSEGRNQRILDLTREDVQDYIIKSMRDVFSSGNIAYVKWDMNRIMSDVYSSKLPAEQQGEVAHRYCLGLYRIMETLTKEFPHILFEGCSSGGNRFDLGILSYFPQIWASDDTDALFRVNCMTNYSYGYPMSTITAHVSNCPNHQTLRVTPLETRFNVAAFGVFGYEFNLPDLTMDELKEIKRQVKFYKNYREIFQYGDFYRGRTGNFHEWTVVSKDKKTAIGMIMQELVQPNTKSHMYFAKGLDPKVVYNFSSDAIPINIKAFGDLINMIAPVHIKNGGVLQNLLSKVYKMPGESENCAASGDTLMYAGVKLKQAFAGTGINGETRFFPDF
ncbi:MAG: alpha-galactosidase, partial [Clostridia bacterium]|nr:alpha-galactosidase [Clostridia bacterium]